MKKENINRKFKAFSHFKFDEFLIKNLFSMTRDSIELIKKIKKDLQKFDDLINFMGFFLSVFVIDASIFFGVICFVYYFSVGL
jgi:hypothetical protein